MNWKRMLKMLKSLEHKGYINTDGHGKEAEWYVLRTANGKPYEPPKVDIVDGVRVTQCDPAYAIGYRDINNGLTVRPKGAKG